MKAVLVTGSRRYSNERAVHEALDRSLERWDGKGFFVVFHGAAKGADMAAQTWVDKVRNLMPGLNVLASAWPADWDRLKRPAGMHRNRKMGAAFLDTWGPRNTLECLVFHHAPSMQALMDGARTGTAAMVEWLVLNDGLETVAFRYHDDNGEVR